MAFQLEATESVRKGVKRIVAKQLDNALQELGAPNRDEVVHEIRKRFKRIRAVLRILHKLRLLPSSRTLSIEKPT